MPVVLYRQASIRKGLADFRAANPDVDVEVAYRSFQLDPSAPEGPGAPVFDGYAKKFGGPEKARARSSIT